MGRKKDAGPAPWPVALRKQTWAADETHDRPRLELYAYGCLLASYPTAHEADAAARLVRSVLQAAEDYRRSWSQVRAALMRGRVQRH